MADDFDLDDLFRDEFKPVFHVNDKHVEESPAPESKVEELPDTSLFEGFRPEALQGLLNAVKENEEKNHPLAIDSAEMRPEYAGIDISVSDVTADEVGGYEEDYEDIMRNMGQAPIRPVIIVDNADDALADLRRRLTGGEPLVNYAEKEEIQEEIDEVISGEIVAYEAPAIEGIVLDVVKDEPSDLEKAVAELERVKALDMENEAQANALRAKINETQKILDHMKAELATHNSKRYERERVVREAESKVSEEAHIAAEKQREADIARERKHAMMQFHSHIEELNPEWKDYAFDHQWEGASTLALHESGLLADEMGLGKTLSAIMYLDMVKAKRVLVITPNDTCSNFTMELAMWAKHRFVYTLAGASKQERNVMMEYLLMPRIEADQDLTLTVNFEQLYSDADYFDQLMDMEFDTIVVDEAHNFKEKKSLLFNRLKSLRTKAQRILPMTGTFILNKPEDIWPALNLVDSEAFPSITQFRDHYCEYDPYNQKWQFRPGGERSMLIRLGGRIVKRNMAEAGIVLPEMHIHDVDIDFPEYAYEDQKNIMRQLADHSQIILDSDRKVSIVEQIALITRQRQCAVWPAGITIKDPETEEILFSVGEDVQESIKMDWVESKIKELRNGAKRIAVFSQFKTALAELERRLIVEGFRVVRYDGDTDKATKALVKRDFDRRHVAKTGDTRWDIVLCNFKTGGVGLNFTDITDMIMLDEEWNPGKNQQAYKRINRIGQTEETHIWIPRLSGAIDGWMKTLNDQKRDLIAGFDNEVDLQKEFSDFLATVRSNV